MKQLRNSSSSVSSKEALSSENWPAASSLHSVSLALSRQLTSLSLWWACSAPLTAAGCCSHGTVTLLGLWLLFLPDHPRPLLMPRILRLSAFFIVQLSHPYMTTRKTIALTIWTFVGKVISLLFNMLSRLVTAFFSKSKNLLIL